MPRFFTNRAVSGALRNRLFEKLAVRSANWDFPQPKTDFEVGWAQVESFLNEVQSEGARAFHDPDFVAPTPSSGCAGSQIFGHALRERLAQRHTLGGEGALIIIVDGGVDADTLRPHGVRFDTTSVKGPATSAGPRIHGTMCAADAFLAAPHATFADLTVSDNRDLASKSVLAAFEGLLETAKGPTFAKYSACVVSVSLQLTAESARDDLRLREDVRLTGNQAHDLWKVAGQLQESGFDVVMAAGNDGCNAEAPYINGLALHPAVLTVGAVDAGNRVDRVSSKGKSGKPDFAAYTNFLWSSHESFDSGTSAATALAAGLLASFRTAKPERHRGKLLPAALMSELMTSLQKPVKSPAQGAMQNPSAHDDSYGWGIL